MQEKTFVVPGIRCSHCVATIRREIGEIRGVADVEADVQTRTVTVRWTEPASWPRIVGTLHEIGYAPER